MNGEADLRQKPIEVPLSSKRPSVAPSLPKIVASEPSEEEEDLPVAPTYVPTEENEEPKSNIGEKIRGFFGSMFE